MITIKTTDLLYKLDGTPLKSLDLDLTVGRAVAGIIGGRKSKDPRRAYRLLKQFADQDEVKLTKSDFNFIMKEIDEDEGWNNVTIGQLFIKLDEALNANTTDNE